MAGISAVEIMEKIMYAKNKFIENNKKEPDYVVISQNLYFRLYSASNFIFNDSGDEDYDTTIFGMIVKLISDNDFLMVGRNEILKLKGEKDVKD